MKEFFKKPFVIGILGSLIVIYFLQPIIDLTGHLLLKSTLSEIEEFVDSKYARASFAKGIDYSYYIASFSIIALHGFIIGIATYIIQKIAKRTSKKEGNSKELKPITIKLILFIAVSYLILVLSYALIQVAGESIALNAISRFNRDMDTLSPYLTEADIRILRSKWAQIKSKKDYEVIYKEMSEIAKKQGIPLRNDNLY